MKHSRISTQELNNTILGSIVSGQSAQVSQSWANRQ
jgi:hypothetical protein